MGYHADDLVVEPSTKKENYLNYSVGSFPPERAGKQNLIFKLLSVLPRFTPYKEVKIL